MSQPDICFTNAWVIDGTGAAPVRGHVQVVADRIGEIVTDASPPPTGARQYIDASGLVLSPGFIDIHSGSAEPLLNGESCASKLSQGITTEIMGETWTPGPVNDLVERKLGPKWHWPRLGQWLDAMESQGVPQNVGTVLAGHNVRAYVMGFRPGKPTAQEMQAMRRVAELAMQDGALGVSYALIYPPDVYTDTREIIEICRVIREYGGIYCTHMRSEGDTLLEALEEAIAIGRGAEIPVEIYHLKACGQRNWDKLPRLLERINRVRCDGVDIEANMYPYTASGTALTTILPPWTFADGKRFDHLDNPATLRRIRDEIMEPDGQWEPQYTVTGPANIMPIDLRHPALKQYNGWRLDRIAADLGMHPIDAALHMLGLERQRVFTAFHKMSEQNLEAQIREPWVKFSTDGGAYDPDTATSMVHPRCYGTMPRILGHYVRDRKLLRLEDAVARVTGHVARRLSITDRGELRPGAMADLVLFNADTITDRSTFEQPHQLSTGVCGVWVNGTHVWDGNRYTGARPGCVLRGRGARLRVRTSGPVMPTTY